MYTLGGTCPIPQVRELDLLTAFSVQIRMYRVMLTRIVIVLKLCNSGKSEGKILQINNFLRFEDFSHRLSAHYTAASTKANSAMNKYLDSLLSQLRLGSAPTRYHTHIFTDLERLESNPQLQ